MLGSKPPDQRSFGDVSRLATGELESLRGEVVFATPTRARLTLTYTL